jgi:adenine-specific DNA-methyltransferase
MCFTRPPPFGDVTLSSVLTLEQRLSVYPRLRYMGSKHRLGARLGEVFAELPPGPAVDAFSGSGVVSYVLKAAGRPVVANDQLAFAAAVTEALVANDQERLTEHDLDTICSGNIDGRDFIQRTFNGLYFPREDHAFLDAAWSHIGTLGPPKRQLAIGALCLAAAWKQPRGVFTITTPRYDDGRRQLHTPLEALFREAALAFNAAVFASEAACESRQGDALAITGEYAVAYLDPPYAPPRDDADYIKRYHFLEGLATYWKDQEIMWETRTRKLVKRHTPFASKRTVRPALERLFEHFKESTLVVSYGSNAAMDVTELEALLRRHKPRVSRIEIPHRYAFGTHAKATRRLIREYVLIAA